MTAPDNKGSALLNSQGHPAGLGTYPGTTAVTVHSPKRPPCSEPLVPRGWAGCKQPPAVLSKGDGSAQHGRMKHSMGNLLPQPKQPVHCSPGRGLHTETTRERKDTQAETLTQPVII